VFGFRQIMGLVHIRRGRAATRNTSATIHAASATCPRHEVPAASAVDPARLHCRSCEPSCVKTCSDAGHSKIADRPLFMERSNHATIAVHEPCRGVADAVLQCETAGRRTVITGAAWWRRRNGQLRQQDDTSREQAEPKANPGGARGGGWRRSVCAVSSVSGRLVLTTSYSCNRYRSRPRGAQATQRRRDLLPSACLGTPVETN